jgi:hypothetical protein
MPWEKMEAETRALAGLIGDRPDFGTTRFLEFCRALPGHGLELYRIIRRLVDVHEPTADAFFDFPRMLGVPVRGHIIVVAAAKWAVPTAHRDLPKILRFDRWEIHRKLRCLAQAARRRLLTRVCELRSSSNSSASFSSITPPSCSASTIVTARR